MITISAGSANQTGNNNDIHNNMATASVPKGIQLTSAGAINEKCSGEGKSLVLFQLGQIQKQWILWLL